MRLLHVDFDPEQKGHVQISLCDHMETENQDLRYAIFSHSWQKDEVLFADVAEPDRALSEATKNKSGFVKLETCCRIALDHGLHYVWSDTCCVDRNSSADVSESVNALFRYYSEAEICIVYLDDVQDHAKDTFFLDRSTWFSESWNLQALVASRDLHYYSQGWIKLGSKASLSRVTSQASGVPERVLVDPSSLDSICVSEKMSWAARRTTTRAEDRAYSLMGLFDVNMPLLYGEGGEKAFRRLQLEIIQVNPDHTIFAWDSETCTGDMLATSVSEFINGSNYEMSGYANIFENHEIAEKINDPRFRNKYPTPNTRSLEVWNLENRTWKPDFSMTNCGLHIQLPSERLPFVSSYLPPCWKEQRFAYLGCRTKSNQMVGIFLQKQPQKGPLSFSRMAFDGRTTFTFDLNACRGKKSPITDYNPIWISKNRIAPSCNENRIPPSTQLIRYELWIKSKDPMPITTRATAHMSESARSVHYVPPPPMYNETLPPNRFTESRLPMRHYVNGIICVGQLDHELISFGSPRVPLYIAFGECDGLVWMQSSSYTIPPGSNANHYDILYQGFSFPIGKRWSSDECRMQPLVAARKGTWVPLATPPRAMSSKNAAVSTTQSLPGFQFDVFMERGAPGELALKIYADGLT